MVDSTDHTSRCMINAKPCLVIGTLSRLYMQNGTSLNTWMAIDKYIIIIKLKFVNTAHIHEKLNHERNHNLVWELIWLGLIKRPNVKIILYIHRLLQWPCKGSQERWTHLLGLWLSLPTLCLWTTTPIWTSNRAPIFFAHVVHSHACSYSCQVKCTQLNRIN